MKILLTKTSPTHHAFVIMQGERVREVVTLETKTFLFHDLLHFAIESEAGLRDSFYGRLARGMRYAELSRDETVVVRGGGEDEILMTERVVGVMTGALKSDADPRYAILAAKNLLHASGEPLPEWFTEDFVLRVKERMRRLIGEWNGTPFGEEMGLSYSLSMD